MIDSNRAERLLFGAIFLGVFLLAALTH